MEAFDYKYIAKLVIRAQIGDSDAFAELYAATYQREYLFSYRYLKDEYLAQDALQETYTLALKNLTKLKDPKLVISWLNQINFRVCYKLHQKQQRYNQEMKAAEEILENDLENSGGGVYRQCRRFHSQNRYAGVCDQSGIETSVYGISGYFAEVL